MSTWPVQGPRSSLGGGWPSSAQVGRWRPPDAACINGIRPSLHHRLCSSCAQISLPSFCPAPMGVGLGHDGAVNPWSALPQRLFPPVAPVSGASSSSVLLSSAEEMSFGRESGSLSFIFFKPFLYLIYIYIYNICIFNIYL